MTRSVAEVQTGCSDKLITAEELFDRGDIGRCELIEGRLVMMAAAGRRHGRVSTRILKVLANFVDAAGIGEVSATDTGFLIARDPDTVRAPDAAFVAASRLAAAGPEEKFWPFAPDLAVEVVSPADGWSEVVAKAHSWLAAGTRMVWVVDPAIRNVHVFRAGRPVVELGVAEELTGEDVLPGFVVKVADLFS